MRKRLLILTFVSIIFLGGLHQVASIFYLYWNSVWFDTFMHFLGGFALAALFLWIWYHSRLIEKRRKALHLTIVFVLLVSVAWEIFEYYFDIANPASQVYMVDTIHDFVFATLGALTGSLLGTSKKFQEIT